METKYYAVGIAVFAALFIWAGYQIPEGFFSDPIGPSGWSVGVGICLLVLAILLFFEKSDIAVEGFPLWQEWRLRLPFIIIIYIYGIVLTSIGFFLATPPMVALIARIFGATWKQASITGICLTLGCYLIFDVLLGISLPIGGIFI